MAKKPATAKKTEPTAQSIKGFSGDLTCCGYQFEIGKTYTHDGKVEACVGGFHACDASEHPLSVFEFYPPAGSRYCDVKQGGTLSRQAGCSKIASATITIGVEITIGELVKRAWDYVWSKAVKSDESHVTIDHGAASATGEQGAASATGWQGAASATGWQGAASATGEQGAASATGWQGAASATGWQGAASATGEQGAASATGWQGAASATGWHGAASATGEQGAASATGWQGAASATGEQGAASATGWQGAASATGEQGAASATGWQGAASATGWQGAASATGEQGAALASGYEGRVMGAGGNALFAVERDTWNGPILSVAAGIVGQDEIEPNVWYQAKAGKLVRA